MSDATFDTFVPDQLQTEAEQLPEGDREKFLEDVEGQRVKYGSRENDAGTVTWIATGAPGVQVGGHNAATASRGFLKLALASEPRAASPSVCRLAGETRCRHGQRRDGHRAGFHDDREGVLAV
jgi:hypothetical protein